MNIDKTWTVEKKIPVALIFAIFVQTSTAIWWASGANSRLSAVEEKSSKLELEVVKLRENGSEAKERFARTEATMLNVVETARRVESKLDRLLDDKQPNRVYGPR